MTKQTTSPISARFARSLMLAASLAGALTVLGADEPKQRPILKPVVASLPVVGGTWTAQGPAPIQNAQGMEGILNHPATGAVNAVVAHPTNPDIVWIGSVNGGIWKTTNATSSSPTWTPLTDTFSSLSISALVRDPSDPTNNTLVAGSGRSSSFGQSTGPLGALLRTTNGGSSWTALNPSGLANRSISALAVQGSTIVASVLPLSIFSCQAPIFLSTDTGGTFTGITSGLPAAGVGFDVKRDPTNSAVYYAMIMDCTTFHGGVYKSSNSGAAWTKVNNAAMDSIFGLNFANIAMGPSGEVYAGIDTDHLRVFRSLNGGSSWTELDNPGNDAGRLSMAVDPSNGNLLYFGQDAQKFPNFIGATSNGSGLLFRLNAAAAPGTQLTPLTHCQTALSGCNGAISTNSNSAPHADSRAITFDANGNLLQTDDGGIFRRTNPSGTGDWFSVNGTLQLSEMHDVVYDHISHMIMGGDQDVGTPEQTSVGGLVWSAAPGTGGDGGDVAADDMSSTTQSTRYASSQGLINFERRIVNTSGVTTSQIYPARLLLGGSNLQGQFVTPVELNRADMRRVLFAGFNDLYESLDRGDTMTALGLNQDVVAAVYGGTSSGVDNPDVIWAIANPAGPAVYLRTSGSGAPVQTAATPGMPLLIDITADTADWHKAYVVNGAGEVFSTSNSGASWTNITGNLASGAIDLRTITFVPPSKLVVGGLYGVFTADTSNPTVWSQLGSGLPNALVYDLDYDALDDVLVASTLGRGAWKLSAVTVSGTLPSLSINDVTVSEGNSGTTNATFTVSLSAAVGYTTAVNYATANGSAVGQSTTFSNPSPIDFSSSQGASPYPSAISVSGVTDPIKKLTVTLNGFASGNPAAADVLLVGPGGQKVILISDAGGTSFIQGADLTFDDAAASQLPQSLPFGGGTYRPTDYEPGDSFPSPAPAGPYGTALSAFNGTSANGTWNLYIVVDTNPGTSYGHVDSWSINFTSGDYAPVSGQLIIPPNTASKTVTVPVFGDTTLEPNETFFVNLSGPVNATIADAQGQGTILNDDVPPNPTNVVATATTTTNVNVTWTAAAGATGYNVYRSSGGGYIQVGAPSGSPFNDSSASANTAYRYKVRAVTGSVESADSNVDLATTVIFTDSTITTGVTFVKVVHFNELLTAVNAVRTLAGLGTIAFTSPAPGANVTVRGAHVTDLRNGLNAARSTLGLSALSYTDPTITAGTTIIKAVHVTDLRGGVQ